jgi:hypothetical protein
MKKLLLLSILAVTFSTGAIAGQFNTCYQHGVSVGGLQSFSTDPDVLGQGCFDKYKGKQLSIDAELVTHPEKFANIQEGIILMHDDIYSRDCWKGEKENFGEGGQ